MMQYPRTIRDFGAHIDGFGYGGRATEAKLPELKLMLAQHRGGGMEGPVSQDMGLEALRAEVTLAEWAPALIKLFGTRKRMVLRPAAMGQEGFTADEYIFTMGGLWSVLNFADLKSGSDMPMKLSLEVDFFRCMFNGEQLFKIDLRAGVREVGEEDQRESLRRAMGY
ncbi:phage major tail tube protein [Epibacterium ulvae]|uniref:phage major tail tube protein n=1 Tax=Epibacterium ulvae TaxID=1156985 RepID=UPI002491C913|nr:phage major tail tube protein [Epibacterium ulvae]